MGLTYLAGTEAIWLAPTCPVLVRYTRGAGGKPDTHSPARASPRLTGQEVRPLALFPVLS